MQILTDISDQIACFFGLAPDAVEHVTDPPDGIDETTVRSFFGGGPVESVRVTGPRMPVRYGPILIQGRARRSNLEIMTDLQRQGAGLPDGLVCVALSGEGFLGRFDRGWSCLEGNLHAVVHLEPRITPEKAGAAFSILAAVACVDAVLGTKTVRGNEAVPKTEAVPPPRIKWINDVYSGGRKIAGVLTRQTYQSPDITNVFLGIGVNVLADPELAADEFVSGTGSLAGVYGEKRTPGAFLLDWIVALEDWYARVLDRGMAVLLPYYRRHSSVTGRRVRVYEDGFGFEEKAITARRLLARGIVEEIREDLSLVIGGIDAPVSAGRLALEEDYINRC